MTRRNNPEAKRQAVLDAACSEMAAQGYAGANTGVIAKRAGVGAGTVFRLFATKQELANKVLQRSLERYEACLDPAFFTTKNPRLQFGYLFRMLVTMYERHPDDFIFAELHFVGPYIDEVSLSRRQRIRDRTDAWIRAHIAGGVIRDAPPELVRAIVIGAFTRFIRESRDTSLRVTNKNIDLIEECTWNAIRNSA